ncbi:MAG: hypothetical protein B7X56_03160, partial [Burkholderiales bacterium 34-67-9]
MVRQHAALAIEAQADPGAIPASDSAYDVAWALARRLGFIEADAAVIAQAWGQRSAREGHWRADWPDDPLDFGLGTAAAATQPGSAAEHPAATNSPLPFAPHPDGLGLYAVLPNAAWVQRMAAAGVPTLQLRYKPSANPGPGTPPEAEVLAQVRAAVAAVASTASRLYINDHWQAAIEA